MEVYNVYNEEFVEEHLLFVYVFRAVSDINLYLSSVVNRFVYFYTQSDIREEIEKLSLVRRINCFRLKNACLENRHVWETIIGSSLSYFPNVFSWIWWTLFKKQ